MTIVRRKQGFRTRIRAHPNPRPHTVANKWYAVCPKTGMRRHGPTKGKAIAKLKEAMRAEHQ